MTARWMWFGVAAAATLALAGQAAAQEQSLLDWSDTAARGVDTTVRVWDIPSGKELVVIRGHALTPFSACFSADGRQILTVSSGHLPAGPRTEKLVGDVELLLAGLDPKPARPTARVSSARLLVSVPLLEIPYAVLAERLAAGDGAADT